MLVLANIANTGQISCRHDQALPYALVKPAADKRITTAIKDSLKIQCMPSAESQDSLPMTVVKSIFTVSFGLSMPVQWSAVGHEFSCKAAKELRCYGQMSRALPTLPFLLAIFGTSAEHVCMYLTVFHACLVFGLCPVSMLLQPTLSIEGQHQDATLSRCGSSQFAWMGVHHDNLQ